MTRFCVSDFLPDASPDLAESPAPSAKPCSDNSAKSAMISKGKGKKPVFTVPLKDYTFLDGTPALLKCELDTTPDTDVCWFKNGRLLPDNNEFAQKFDGKEAVLDILEVFPEDAGNYVCEAENDDGITKTSCVVKIIASGGSDLFSGKSALYLKVFCLGFCHRSHLFFVSTSINMMVFLFSR